jgi:hypothetical protein
LFADEDGLNVIIFPRTVRARSDVLKVKKGITMYLYEFVARQDLVHPRADTHVVL